MGVSGLRTFFSHNDGKLTKNHRLHDTCIVIDTSNLINVLSEQSQNQACIYGCDLVRLANCLNKFYDNLKKCNIKPIMILDGAQTNKVGKSKTDVKLRRSIEGFKKVGQINDGVNSSHLICPLTTTINRSILVNRGIRMIQCIFEADTEIARIANELQCPVMSNDSDFLLMDLHHGVISIDDLEWNHIHYEKSSGLHYLNSKIYKHEFFDDFLPGLDTKTLPMLGVLAGNDFLDERTFRNICERLPMRNICENRGISTRQFRTMNKRQARLVKIIHFLQGKTTDQIISQICGQVPSERRSTVRKTIRDNLSAFKVPTKDEFENELAMMYWSGFKATYKNQMLSDSEMNIRFHRCIEMIIDWLKQAMEHSLLNYRILELMNRNTIFIRPHMDSYQLESAQKSYVKILETMLTLTRSRRPDNRSLLLYDRKGDQYKWTKLTAKNLQINGVSIDYLMYDIPTLPLRTRCQILLANFHCNTNCYNYNLANYESWFALDYAEELLMVEILMDSLNKDGPRLWLQFRLAVWLCIVYYLYTKRSDRKFLFELECDGSIECMEELSSILGKYKSCWKGGKLRKAKSKNYCRIMHQITQLQSSILAYNQLNAFLGDAMVPIRAENWLNCCLLYNLTENLRINQLDLPPLPKIDMFFRTNHRLAKLNLIN